MKKILALLLIAAALSLALCPALAAGYVCLTGDAYVRTGPGLGYASIGVAKEDTTLTYRGSTSVDGRGVAWYAVYFGGSAGWVSSRYAALNSAGTPGAPYVTGRVYAATGSTKIRTGAGLGYAEVGTLFQGSSLPYLGTASYDSRGVAWYAVEYRGATCWVSSRYTSLY